MNGKAKKDNLEISSDQLQAELVEIKERLGTLETLTSISNQEVVEAYVRRHLTTEKGRLAVRSCEAAQTREQLVSKLGLASGQALDHHLRPLHDDGLLRKFLDDGGKVNYVWSNLFKSLPKKTRNLILGIAT
jgi:hypothetical protein